MSSSIIILKKRIRGFTLIELLIVIGILAVLATVTLLVLNPAQMVKQSRDSNRMTEIQSINQALLMYQAFGGDTNNMGTHGTVYISIPSTNTDCGYSEGNPLGLPSLSGGYLYHCSDFTHYRNIDGTGWIPVDLTSVQSSAGTLFSSYPIDPINTVPGGLYYTYIPGSWALSATMESDKYLAANAANDGGSSATRFELGNNLALDVNLTAPTWACGNTLVDSRNSKSYATVLIGSQCWMAQNMDYDNGCSTKTWVNSTDVGWCGYYTGGPYPNEGLLYQWSVAMNGSASCNGTGAPPNDVCSSPVQGICPTGWHIPSHYELTTLERAVCTSGTCATDFPYDTTTTGWRGTDEGTKLKVGGSSGFNGIIGGYRDSGTGNFYNESTQLFIWSSTESGSNAWLRSVNSSNSSVFRTTDAKPFGFSVRCLKN
ncbi:MAG: prepilin-type N-terminal cleavage/methylation domain-containing protein [Patescibacteria group bacterium]|nr:prepilin-type N-terminal cleavage/methylation domain-containing protein [Patescibacteria group bacterium]